VVEKKKRITLPHQLSNKYISKKDKTNKPASKTHLPKKIHQQEKTPLRGISLIESSKTAAQN
jgi:hypothetical protein